jgi:hypothetical protein
LPWFNYIANARNIGLILFLGFGKGFITPRIPVYRIMGVLKEVE